MECDVAEHPAGDEVARERQESGGDVGGAGPDQDLGNLVTSPSASRVPANATWIRRVVCRRRIRSYGVSRWSPTST
jgi:hypothetical protein